MKKILFAYIFAGLPLSLVIWQKISIFYENSKAEKYELPQVSIFHFFSLPFLPRIFEFSPEIDLKRAVVDYQPIHPATRIGDLLVSL